MAVETVPATTHPVDDAAAHGVASAGDHAATTSAEHGGGGLPQFQFEHWAGQIGYLLILFVILYVLIAKVFAPRMRRVFDERETTIADALSSARAVQAQADSQAEDARRALADARAASQRTASEAKAKAQAEASARKAELEADLSAKQAEAEARIRAARESAMQQLATVATDAAEAMVEKLTGAKAPRGAVAAAIKSQG
jgi:F-type H+-transporting ATPase subunit b